MKIYVFPEEDISCQLFRNTRINQISVLLQIICDIVLLNIHEPNVSNNKIILFLKPIFCKSFSDQVNLFNSVKKISLTIKKWNRVLGYKFVKECCF